MYQSAVEDASCRHEAEPKSGETERYKVSSKQRRVNWVIQATNVYFYQAPKKTPKSSAKLRPLSVAVQQEVGGS